MSLWKRIKAKIKKGFVLRLFGYEFHFVGRKQDPTPVKQPMLSAAPAPAPAAAAAPKPAPAQYSPTQDDVFKNDFQFNMFVESNLDMDVKRNIIAQTFYKNVGYYPNINCPKTFSEKVLWLKLYYDDPRIAEACDKVHGKAYVDKVLGPGYTVPIIKTYHDVFEINLNDLPNRFALKVNWATGCNIIVKDKSKVNLNEVRATLDRWMLPWKSSYYGTFNRGYRYTKPIVFAEEYLDIPKNSTEYKVFCFNGKAKWTLVELDYFGAEPARAYYDRNWNEVPWQFGNIKKVKVEKKPDTYDEIIRLAEILAEPFPYIRVDFYDIGGKLYVGELTFYSGGGFSNMKPRAWDIKLGEQLDLSDAMKYVYAKENPAFFANNEEMELV